MTGTEEAAMGIDLSAVKAALPHMTPEQKEKVLELLSLRDEIARKQRARGGFIEFVRWMWPEFIESGHHRVMADAFDRVERGECKRLMINMGPRHTKSEFASKFFPAYCLGRNPRRKLMQCANTGELAVGFGRQVRNIVDSDEYKNLFDGVTLSDDSRAAGRWNTNKNGEYFASGVGGVVTGRGADILVIDDPHSEQEAALNSLSIYNNAYEWYMAGPRQRLQPGGAIVIVATRWHTLDLCGRLLKDMAEREGADQWEVIELPAIVDEHTPEERPIWPSFWDIDELRATRATLPAQKWQAQYQQRPTSEEGAVIKREWWRTWDKKEPPECRFVIQAWDTAYTAKQSSDFNACSTWGVFDVEDESGETQANLILLDAYKARLEFPELKREALAAYEQFQPDACLIEAKASGWPLIQELRRLGIPVTDVTQSRGTKQAPNDKLSRLNAVSDLFASGYVWAPDTRFAEEVIEEFASFPFGQNDDLVDTGIMVLQRFRDGGFLRLPTDHVHEEDTVRKRRVANFY